MSESVSTHFPKNITKVLIKKTPEKSTKKERISKLLDILEDLNASIQQCDNCKKFDDNKYNFVECAAECGYFLCQNCVEYTKHQIEDDYEDDEVIKIYCTEDCINPMSDCDD